MRSGMFGENKKGKIPSLWDCTVASSLKMTFSLRS